jgi:hypothetical protein
VFIASLQNMVKNTNTISEDDIKEFIICPECQMYTISKIAMEQIQHELNDERKIKFGCQ